MNILLLSVGTRNKIVQYFKKELSGIGRVVVTDMSMLAPAIYDADKYYIVSSIDSSNYLNEILDICKKENINGVLSLIDPELSILSKHEELFKKIGVKVIGSNYKVCELSLDKYEMYKWLINHEFKCAKSYNNKQDFYQDLDKGSIQYPVIIKPARGSASIEISKVCDSNTLDLLMDRNENLMIQEYLSGQEIGADVYIDMISKEVVSIFTKKKLKMRAGETDKSVSFKNDSLNELIKNFVKEMGYVGQIDIDIFEINGEYYISEVNPRFGGGYPHAYECGCNHIKMIINNLDDKINEYSIGLYEDGVYMLKYNELTIMKM